MPHYQVLRVAGGAALKVRLSKGELIKAESDALVVKNEWIELGANMDGGVLGGLARKFLTGESLYFQTLKATQGDDNEVLLAAQMLGDIALVELSTLTDTLCLQSGAFLAADDTVNIGSAMQRNLIRSAFSGSGMFILEAKGTGSLAFSSYGGVVVYRLQPGETISVDNGHVVAWSSWMEWKVGMASRSMFTAVASGEGIMCHFVGPGTVYVQTHKPPPPDGKRGGGVGRRGASSAHLGAAEICVVFVVVLFFALVFGIVVYTMIYHPDNIQWGSGPSSGRRHRPKSIY